MLNDPVNGVDPDGAEVYTADVRALAGLGAGGKISVSISFDTDNFQTSVSIKAGAGAVAGEFVGGGLSISPSEKTPQPAKNDVVGKLTVSADASAGAVASVGVGVSTDVLTTSISDGSTGPTAITDTESFGLGEGAAISATLDVSITVESTIAKDALELVGIKSNADKPK